MFILKFFFAPMASSYTPYWRNAPTITSKAFYPTQNHGAMFRYVTYAYCNILANSTHKC